MAVSPESSLSTATVAHHVRNGWPVGGPPPQSLEIHVDIVHTALPIGLGIVMLGLGLGLKMTDFTYVFTRPRAFIISLITQLLVMPLVALALVLAFRLDVVLALGMILLASTPGGPVTNVYTKLFGGDVALSVSLTTINSFLAVVIVPLYYNLGVWFFQADRATLGLQFGEIAEVLAVIVIPIFLGILVRRWNEGLADRLDRPVRIMSLVVLIVLIIGAVVVNREILLNSFTQVAGVTATFGLLNLVIGYLVPRLFGVGERQSITCAFEIGIHNAVMAVVIAQTVIGSQEMSLAPGMYTLLQLPTAFVIGIFLSRRLKRSEAAAPADERSPAPTP